MSSFEIDDSLERAKALLAHTREITDPWPDREQCLRDAVAAALRVSRRTPPTKLKCIECGAEFEGPKNRLLCGKRRCKDRCYARLHAEKLAAKQRRKYGRRKSGVNADQARR